MRNFSNVIKNSDSIVFSIDYLHKQTYNGSWPVYEQGTDTLVFYPDILTEAYPNEIVTDPQSFPNFFPGGDTLILKLDHHEWGGIRKTVIFMDSGVVDPTSIFTKVQEGILAPIEYESTWSYNWFNLPEYAADFTFYESELFGFEWSYKYDLVGFIDDGDTTGLIYPDDVLLGLNQYYTNSNSLIYPNPAIDQIYLHSSQTGNINYQIFNYSGLLVDEQTINKTAEDIIISVDGFSSGVYLVKLIQNNNTEVMKFVKK